MPCADRFDETTLYVAANRSDERVTVSRKDLQVIIDCCLTASPEDRAFEHSLRIEGKGAKLTVDRAALFALLKRHAKSHEAPMQVQRQTGGVIHGEVGTPEPVAFSRMVAPRPVSAANADALALALREYLGTDAETRFKVLCKANGIDPAKFAGRGFGLQRMALGNELRNRLKKGVAVTVGDKVLK